MKFVKARLFLLAAASAVVALAPSATLAQRQAPTPEQRIDRLERQVQQVQRQAFPKGRPADTAGFADDPAASRAAVMSLGQRLDAIERQMQDLVRQSEENGNRLRGIEADSQRMRADHEQRILGLEQRLSQAAVVVPPAGAIGPAGPATPTAKPRPQPPRAATTTPDDGAVALAEPASDPAEDAYSQGFHMWEAGQYDQAITALRAFSSAYPKHRRASYANNLIGRSLLDKGQARAAAEALLANYRNNPQGERASDSLFYLGQALMKLGQPAQACKAYAELDAVYGAKIRPDLKTLETDAKSQAQCS
ncbi:MAG: tetratricopeptide repeat protein [Sphingomicrobium sp.]